MTQPHPGPAPFGPPAHKPNLKPLFIILGAFGVFVVFFIGVMVGSVGATASTDASPRPTVTVTVTPKASAKKAEPAPTVTKTVTPKPKPKVEASASIPGDGTYTVGKDIKAGTYKTAGAADSIIPNCYWARLKNTSGGFDAIITNGNTKGQATVTISSGDAAFETKGCDKWEKVD